MQVLLISHKGYLGLSARLFDDADSALVLARLADAGFSFDGRVFTRSVAGSPEAVAAIVSVVDNGFTVDGGCGKLETDLTAQIFAGFDLLGILNIEQPAWYTAYLASLNPPQG